MKGVGSLQCGLLIWALGWWEFTWQWNRKNTLGRSRSCLHKSLNCILMWPQVMLAFSPYSMVSLLCRLMNSSEQMLLTSWQSLLSKSNICKNKLGRWERCSRPVQVRQAFLFLCLGGLAELIIMVPSLFFVHSEHVDLLIKCQKYAQEVSLVYFALLWWNTWSRLAL